MRVSSGPEGGWVGEKKKSCYFRVKHFFLKNIDNEGHLCSIYLKYAQRQKLHFGYIKIIKLLNSINRYRIFFLVDLNFSEYEF